MTIDEAVDRAAREASEIIAAREVAPFYGTVSVKFQADTIVTIEITETFKAA